MVYPQLVSRFRCNAMQRHNYSKMHNKALQSFAASVCETCFLVVLPHTVMPVMNFGFFPFELVFAAASLLPISLKAVEEP
eukprot:COSAG01_NODE_17317_length_1160_cov_1571.686145_1_plen_80_part_00